ncbi:MAG: RDD family protein [Actinomycetes bacterium]
MTAVPVGPGRSDVPAVARDFQGHRAGIVTRVLAGGVDLALVIAVLIGTWLSWAAVRFLLDPKSFSFPAPPIGVVLVDAYIVATLYLTIAWATTGRTYGGQLLGLRVVNWRGNRMSWPGAFVRAGFCVLFPIGLAWIVLSRGNRSVQDVVLRTSVVYDWALRQGRTAAVPVQQES